MSVYFIKPVGMQGPIKIGVSRKPIERMRGVEFWSPIPIELLVTIPGDEDLERRFHARFLADHSHREWFRWSWQLHETIEQIKAGTFDVGTLPSADGSYGVGLRRRRTLEERQRHSAAMLANSAERRRLAAQSAAA